MTRFRSLLALAVALILAACAHAPADNRSDSDIVILISIDGFRPDYLDRGATPALSALAAAGVRAAMRPSFPSVTFPNHYTLITGKRPDRHGIVNNRFFDARKNDAFSMNPAVAHDPLWWEQGTPLWVSGERQGVRTATLFWPGSDYELQGFRPSRWRAFDESLSSFARVDALLTWLDAPPAERPRFLTLYFDLVDTAGHLYGADAPETTSAAAEVDAAVARLVAGLRARGMDDSTNLVIVADHGMANLSDDRIIDLQASAASGVFRVIWDGAFAGIEPGAGRAQEAEALLLGRKEHGECWRKAEMPARFAYGANPRVPSIVCLADIGWRYRSRAPDPAAAPYRATHGFDPAAPEMAAIFIASGPAFRKGARLPSFDNVSVYPLLAKLAGIRPEQNDGNIADLAPALAE